MTRHRNAGFRHDLARFELEEPHAAEDPSGRGVSRLNAVLRPLIIALLVLAALPAAASAAVVDIEISPEGGADFGETHAVTGKLTGPYGAPLVGRQVALEIRRYPYKAPFVPAGTATTGLDGRFAFEHEFDRNHQVRVLAPEFGDRSAVKSVYVFPRTSLTFSLVRRNVIRIVQTYRTPKNVKLTAPTLFYVGQSGKPRAPLAARAKTKPVTRKVKGKKQAPGRQGPLPRQRAGPHPRRLEGPLPLRELLPVQRGDGQPEAGLPEEALQVLER